jgi:fatty acid-binding protein DegV
MYRYTPNVVITMQINTRLSEIRMSYSQSAKRMVIFVRVVFHDSLIVACEQGLGNKDTYRFCTCSFIGA